MLILHELIMNLEKRYFQTIHKEWHFILLYSIDVHTHMASCYCSPHPSTSDFWRSELHSLDQRYLAPRVPNWCMSTQHGCRPKMFHSQCSTTTACRNHKMMLHKLKLEKNNGLNIFHFSINQSTMLYYTTIF